MDLATWISIVGVLATLAVGLPVYWLKQGDRTSGAAGRELTVNQNVNVSQRYSQQTPRGLGTPRTGIYGVFLASYSGRPPLTGPGGNTYWSL